MHVRYCKRREREEERRGEMETLHNTWNVWEEREGERETERGRAIYISSGEEISLESGGKF